MAAPAGGDDALHHRRRRHVVDHGGAADDPGRFWRQPRQRIPALHHGHVRLCRRRRADGTAGRSLRHRRTARPRNARGICRLSRDRVVIQPVAGCACAPADRHRLLGQLRSADGGYLALVCPPARHRGIAGRRWKLRRGHNLATRIAAFHRHVRLARDPYRGRLVLSGDDDAAGALHAPAHRGSSRRRDRSGRGGTAGQHAGFADDLASPAVHLLALPAASRCRCRRCTSSPIAATSVMASHGAPRCCR